MLLILVGTFNQEKALVGAFSVIIQLCRWIFATVNLGLATNTTNTTVMSQHGPGGGSGNLQCSTQVFTWIMIAYCKYL